MTDTGLIARIYPVYYDAYAQDTLTMNDTRLRKALPRPSSSKFKKTESNKASPRASRAPTRSPSPHAYNPDDNMDCLELRFTNGPKTNRGFVFGRDRTSDIVLSQRLTSVSNYHFAITFENDFEDTDEYRLVLRDLNSREGTNVTYQNNGDEFRRDFRWILSGHDNACDKTIIIEIPQRFLLRIVVFVPRISGPLLERVENLLRQRSPESSVVNHDLNKISGAETAAFMRSANSTPVLIDIAELGRGAFAKATHGWNVSTGRVFARKTPLQPLTKHDRTAWRREAQLLAKISHQHIIRVFELFEGPNNTLELHLEAALGGTLRSILPLPSYAQSLEVLHQCLSALSYLHGLSPPIVHRDIKPENILVGSADRDIQVKLADFGFSREDRSLISLCGTPKYYPPELREETEWRSQGGQQRSYSPAVDIWSLGVVASECLHGLPEISCRRGLSWCKLVIMNIQANLGPPRHLSRFLLSGMVVMNSAARKSAQQCYDHVVELLSMEEHRAGHFVSKTRSTEPEGSQAIRPHYGAKRFPGYPVTAEDEDSEATILPTIEGRGGGDDIENNKASLVSASHPRSSRRGPQRGSKTPMRSSRWQRRAAPYPPRRSRPSASASASTATANLQRETQPVVMVPVAEEVEESQSNPEPQGAESGYFAANFLLDPLCVGSSVARMGREPPSSFGTSTATLVPQQEGVPQSVQTPAPGQRDAGAESEVVLTDDWLRDSGEEGGGMGEQDQATWTESQRRLADSLLQEVQRLGWFPGSC